MNGNSPILVPGLKGFIKWNAMLMTLATLLAFFCVTNTCETSHCHNRKTGREVWHLWSRTLISCSLSCSPLDLLKWVKSSHVMFTWNRWAVIWKLLRGVDYEKPQGSGFSNDILGSMEAFKVKMRQVEEQQTVLRDFPLLLPYLLISLQFTHWNLWCHHLMIKLLGVSVYVFS